MKGSIGIADDITVHGHMEAEHDAHLCKLMEVAWKYGLVFNPNKTKVKAPIMKFFGCLYDESEVHPEPEKVNAVHTLPTPINIIELQEFLGMVTYLSPFIPGLSTLTAPLCELLKKDADFSWDASCQISFQSVKDAIVLCRAVWCNWLILMCLGVIILHMIVCTAIHNCSSSGSLSLQHLGRITKVLQ